MSFKKQLGKFRQATVEDAEQARRAIILRLLTAIIRDTPVDTGRARGNWQTSVGEPKQGTLKRKWAPSSIREVTENMGGPDSTIYMTNNLPYIQFLEMGSSKKAPHGMVRKNIARLDRIVKQSVATKKKK